MASAKPLIFLMVVFLVAPALAAGATFIPLDLGNNHIHPVNLQEGKRIDGQDTFVILQNGEISFGSGNNAVNVTIDINGVRFTPAGRVIEGNTLTWTAITGEQIRYIYLNTILKEEITLPNEIVLSRLTFDIVTSSPSLKIGTDANGDLIFTRGNAEIFRSPAPFATDANQNYYTGRWRITGNRITISMDLTGAIYPITIDPTFTKLPNPVILPTGNGKGVAFSPDGNYLSIAHTTTPYITIYAKNLSDLSNWTKLADPATLPTSTGYGVAFSPDTDYMAIAHLTAPNLTIYMKNLTDPSNWTKLADPVITPTGQGKGVAFSPDGNYLSVAHVISPFITIYAKDFTDPSNWTKLADPVTLPISTGNGVSFSPDGNYLTLGYSTVPPAIIIYKRNTSDASNWTKLQNPATLPTNTANGVAFSQDANYMTIAHATSPYLTNYQKNLTALSNWTKLANPITLPESTGDGAAFSPDSFYMGIANADPSGSPRLYVTIYAKDLTVESNWTKVTDPATQPTGQGYGIAFSPDRAYMAVAHTTTPFLTIYMVNGDPVTNIWSGTPTSGAAPLLVTFNDTSLNGTNYIWDFGDSSAIVTGFLNKNTTHTYSDAGTYSVGHAVSNWTTTIWNNQTDYITVTGGGEAPIAAFSCTPIAGVRNSTRTCTDASTNTPTSWDWFGAPSNPCIGYNTTIQSPNIFPLNYSWCSICLIATNAQGSDTECKTNYLYVSQPQVML